LKNLRGFDAEEIAEKYIEGEPKISEVAVYQDEEIGGLNTENVSLTEGIVRYDILFYAFVPMLNETVELIINIEAQNKFSPGYPLLKRAVYYCARLISMQHRNSNESNMYGEIKKVFSIWICTNAPKNKRNTITRFSFSQNNLVGKAVFKKKDYDLIEIIMVCLGKDSDGENYGGLLKMLNVLLSKEINVSEKKNILENEYNIKMTKTIEREALGMCNISDGIYESGIQEGILMGRQEGRQEGISLIVKMCKEFGISLEDTIKRVFENFDLPQEEAEKEVKKRWE